MDPGGHVRVFDDKLSSRVALKNDAESAESAFDAGADHYIAKPFHSAELIARLGTAVRRMWVFGASSWAISNWRVLA
jgi:DNA-binding response OmpR family regulator